MLGTFKSDRYSIITDCSWSEYLDTEFPNNLVSFRDGVITIMSPGRNHEIIGDLIRAVIWFYCRRYKIQIFTFNQTRLKAAQKEGKEPDLAYCFGIDKDKPDLAVEINLTSGSIDDLTKYQYLNVPEAWIWEQNKIRFFVCRDYGYLELTNSQFLSGLKSDRVTKIVNESFGKSPLSIEFEV